MKKIYSLLLVFALILSYSQALLTVSESPIGSGVIKIKYNDAANSWAFYNPNSATDIWLHTWVNNSDSSANSSYNDDWLNSTEKLTWDNVEDAFVGYINLNTHTFVQGTITPGATITNLNFIFKDKQIDASWVDEPAGLKKQTGDLKAIDYGFTNITILGLSVTNINNNNFRSFVSNGRLYTTQKGNVNIQIMDFSGRIVKTINAKLTTEGVDLNLPKKGNYLLKIGNEVVKFAY